MEDLQLYIYVWIYENSVENLNSRIKRAFFSYKQSQCFFPSSARLSCFCLPPFSTVCPFQALKKDLKFSEIKVQLNSRIKRAFFLARTYLQSRRYKNYNQSQCFFPSSAHLSCFRFPPVSTICPFQALKKDLKFSEIKLWGAVL